MRKTRKNSLSTVFKSDKGGISYIADTLTNIISQIDPALILQDILGMDAHSRVAAYLKLAEVNSKLLRDISTIEKDKFIMSLDKLDEAEEIFVVLDNEMGLHITDNPTPKMIEVSEIQNEIIEEIVSDISQDTSSNTLSETNDFADIQYVEPVRTHHSPKRRKPIGY